MIKLCLRKLLFPNSYVAPIIWMNINKNHCLLEISIFKGNWVLLDKSFLCIHNSEFKNTWTAVRPPPGCWRILGWGTAIFCWGRAIYPPGTPTCWTRVGGVKGCRIDGCSPVTVKIRWNFNKKIIFNQKKSKKHR